MRAVWCILKFSRTGDRVRGLLGDTPGGTQAAPAPADEITTSVAVAGNGAHRGDPDRTR